MIKLVVECDRCGVRVIVPNAFEHYKLGWAEWGVRYTASGSAGSRGVDTDEWILCPHCTTHMKQAISHLSQGT